MGDRVDRLADIRRLTDVLSALWWMMSNRLLVYCTGVAR